MTFSIDIENRVDRENLQIDTELLQEIERTLRFEARDLQRFLESKSPRGVSPPSQALATNWEIEIDPDGDTFFEIRNESENALQKIAGVPPGRGSVSADEFSAIDNWVRVKLGVPEGQSRRVAGGIVALQNDIGSQRYRLGQNFLQLDRDTGEPGPGSRIMIAAERIESSLNEIDLRF